MPRTFSFTQYLLGIEGLTLLRSWLVGDEEFVRRRIDEVEALCAQPVLPDVTVEERPVGTGYATWSSSYDDTPNAIMTIADTAIAEALRGVPPGRALDMACGTGRLSERLVAAGHRVTGVDSTAEMLTRARKRLPSTEFAIGDNCALPVRDGSFDLVTCGLALAHHTDLAGPVGEIGRVLRPGGHAVIVDVHPMIVLLGGHAAVALGPHELGVVRNHHHPHSAYLRAFRRHGLDIVDCLEPAFDDRSRISSSAAERLPEATRAAFSGLPAVLLWVLQRNR